MIVLLPKSSIGQNKFRHSFAANIPSWYFSPHQSKTGCAVSRGSVEEHIRAEYVVKAPNFQDGKHTRRGTSPKPEFVMFVRTLRTTSEACVSNV